MAGIAAAGLAAPRYRVPRDAYEEAWGRFAARDVEAKAVPAHDEDRVTLAVAAARDALAAAEGADPSLVVLATADDAPRAEPVAEALGLGAASLEVLAGSPARGVQALARARDHAAARGEAALAVAAEAPRGRPEESAEHGLAAGAAALLVTPDGPATLGPGAGRTREALGGGRRDAHGLRRDHPVGARAREVLADAAEAAVDAAGAGAAGRAAAYPPGGAGLGAEAVTAPRRVAGDLLAAAPLAALVDALGDPAGDPVLVGAAGSGDAAALVVEAPEPVPGAGAAEAAFAAAEPVGWDEHVRQQGLLPPHPAEEELPMGAHVPMDDFNATAGERYRLEGRECADCGELHFPPRPTCRGCHGTSFEPAPLSGEAEVVASTTIGRGGAPSEFAREQRLTGSYDVAIVEMAEGPRVVARLADVEPGEAGIGDAVEPVLRRLYEQEGAVRYGTKFRPA